jgi:hypothetical protein
MIIHRISGQKNKTLFEFYTPTESQRESTHVALNGMRQLLRHLDTVDGPELYAFTSLSRLCFVNGDDYKLPVIAMVVPGCGGETPGNRRVLFHIGYPPTPNVLRDHTKWNTETTDDVYTAAELLLQAFRSSAFSPYA